MDYFSCSTHYTPHRTGKLELESLESWKAWKAWKAGKLESLESLESWKARKLEREVGSERLLM